MKVILLKQKRGLGKVGDNVEVKDGYGRNYLIPQGFAVRATASNQAMIVTRRNELEKQNAEVRMNAEAISSKIEGKDFTFIRQSGDDGRLFGSVSAKDIAQVLNEKTGFEIIHSNIALQHPIKSIGIYTIETSLHAEVISSILVNVARSESEAKDAITGFKSENTAKDSKASNNSSAA